jgi:hypothetical protein
MYSAPLTVMDSRNGLVLGHEESDAGLRLPKLHGSLNWRYPGSSAPAGNIVQEVGHESTGYGSRSITRAVNWGVEAFSRSVDDGWPSGSD